MASDGRATLDELDDNELATTTMVLVDRIRPHLGLILLAIGVLFAVLAGIVLVRSQQAAERTAAWEACLGALAEGDPARLEEVAVRHRGTPAAWWAELVMADTALADGNRLLLSDPARARERLAAAAELYAGVNAQRPMALAAERGVFGLARTRESQGQLEEASRGYEALVADYPQSPFRGLAESRLEALGRPATRRWYKWFATQPAAPARDESAPAAEPAGTSAEPPAAAPAG